MKKVKIMVGQWFLLYGTNTPVSSEESRFFVTWYGSIGGHKSTKSLSGKRLN
ncbi:unknown protein [Microcystis aeruginosa NIES-843]|uniref:Uncharacterized protein n=1 Tax=Microcystis aeruginosa (strain NIES-843 / IAM M-2473) TaxID=449447 RepID=B0JNM0_MICAN|nr:unknown protein [Microcystis aeruginosa NIES-843]